MVFVLGMLWVLFLPFSYLLKDSEYRDFGRKFAKMERYKDEYKSKMWHW